MLPLVVERETIKEDGTVVRRCVSAVDVAWLPVCNAITVTLYGIVTDFWVVFG